MNEKVSLIAKILVVIGALNWGLVAISAKAELIQYLQVDWLIRIVYGLVGIAGLIALAELVQKK
jgi:uncharacterized membrane protein YuzA (DUF378 family)